MENLKKRLAGEKMPPQEYRLFTKDGREITGLHSNKVLELDGRKAVLGIIADISESKKAAKALAESEERYRTLINTSPDAITVTDLEGKITFASPQTLRLHGFDFFQEMIGKNALEMIDPDDHERAVENLKKTLSEGSVRNLEYRMLRKDGTTFIGELNASLIKDSEGNPTAFIASVRDITEHKNAVEKLNEKIDELEKWQRLTVAGRTK